MLLQEDFGKKYAMAFYHIKVFNPLAKTHLAKKKLEAAFASAEEEKKTAYNERCIQVEHRSFTPVVFLVTPLLWERNKCIYLRTC